MVQRVRFPHAALTIRNGGQEHMNNERIVTLLAIDLAFFVWVFAQTIHFFGY